MAQLKQDRARSDRYDGDISAYSFGGFPEDYQSYPDHGWTRTSIRLGNYTVHLTRAEFERWIEIAYADRRPYRTVPEAELKVYFQIAGMTVPELRAELTRRILSEGPAATPSTGRKEEQE